MGIIDFKTEPDTTKVFEFFEKICSIPHGSTNTKAISDYIAGFAKDKGLRFIQDESNNVIIFKDGVLGGEDKDPVILQGHIDMVCEKTEDSTVDPEKDPLKLLVEDGYLTADGTTLGGDDGIAVAYMLALLDSDDIPYPPIECVFTVDEEIGLLGAKALDMSVLRGKKLLNIDSEVEGELLISCAGGAAVNNVIPVQRRGAQGEKYIITVSGLKGGHSGTEIDKGHANADVVLINAVKDCFYNDDSLRLVSICGGTKDNAIPVKAEAVIITKNIEDVKNTLKGYSESISAEYKGVDTINIDICPIDASESSLAKEAVNLTPIMESDNLSLIMALSSYPNGVQKYAEFDPSFVQTSLNLGILRTDEEGISFTFLVRSSQNKEIDLLISDITFLTKSAGGTVTVSGDYPAWEYKSGSYLERVMTSVYEQYYRKPMKVLSVHAGVECGLFVNGIEGLEAVSFGPDLKDIHTPREKLGIESAARTWGYLQAVLKKLSE